MKRVGGVYNNRRFAITPFSKSREKSNCTFPLFLPLYAPMLCVCVDLHVVLLKK
uniref:Uncharacterized protein n=1 Tax=Anguilla anguilla TaxID=7936 RepID=A0A0E9UV55_ANGAN